MCLKFITVWTLSLLANLFINMLEPVQLLGGASLQAPLHVAENVESFQATELHITQSKSVLDMLHRVAPRHAHLFKVNIQPGRHRCGIQGQALEGLEEENAWFEVRCDGENIFVNASSGVEAAAGIHTYFKERCGASITWAATGGKRLPETCFDELELVRLIDLGPLRRARVVPLQYYQNVVTSSYSMTWWDWERWEQEIDWMALQGVNLPLAFAGQEYVWMRVFVEFGIEAQELEGFFSGPAFLAWQRMGNLQGYAGPLPVSFMERHAELQKRIVARMRSFGMCPVLPAFAGFVPAAFVQRHPMASYSRATRWGGFPDKYCSPYMLHPLDPLFQEVGAAFIREQRALYGWEDDSSPSFYAADTFNEMRPSSSDPAYLASISAAVYKAMSCADPNARWLMQAWLFFSDQAFWGHDQIKALLGGVPRERLVLLDLFAETHPQWNKTDSFQGVPFIWCMLHNFGGNNDMYGALPAAVEGFNQALESGSSVVGLGTAPEGIEQNPVVYDLINELSFRPSVPSLKDWFSDYVVRRYGPEAPSQAGMAWQLLRETVYDCRDGHINTVMDIPISRPGMSRSEIGLWGLHPHLWYDPSKTVEAWRLLTQCGKDLGALPGYRYDLVDLGRNVLSKHSTQIWWDIVVGYYNRDADQVGRAARKLLDMLSDMDSLLATNPGFMLGPKIAEARAVGSSPAEKDLYERNLRAQITHWGTSPDGDSEVHDYASKMWAGMVGGYYRDRWQQWTDRLLRDLQEGTAYDPGAWRKHTVQFTLEWAQDTGASFPVEPEGDPVTISQALLEKYFPTCPIPAGPVEMVETNAEGSQLEIAVIA